MPFTFSAHSVVPSDTCVSSCVKTSWGTLETVLADGLCVNSPWQLSNRHSKTILQFYLLQLMSVTWPDQFIFKKFWSMDPQHKCYFCSSFVISGKEEIGELFFSGGKMRTSWLLRAGIIWGNENLEEVESGPWWTVMSCSNESFCTYSKQLTDLRTAIFRLQ